MTTRRFVRKAFRNTRKKVCRYIVGFDRCPTSYRKNYKNIILNTLACFALCFFSIVSMMLLALLMA